MHLIDYCNLQGLFIALGASFRLRAAMVNVEDRKARNNQHDKEGNYFKSHLLLFLKRQDIVVASENQVSFTVRHFTRIIILLFRS